MGFGCVAWLHRLVGGKWLALCICLYASTIPNRLALAVWFSSFCSYQLQDSTQRAPIRQGSTIASPWQSCQSSRASSLYTSWKRPWMLHLLPCCQVYRLFLWWSFVCGTSLPFLVWSSVAFERLEAADKSSFAFATKSAGGLTVLGTPGICAFCRLPCSGHPHPDSAWYCASRCPRLRRRGSCSHLAWPPLSRRSQGWPVSEAQLPLLFPRLLLLRSDRLQPAWGFTEPFCGA